MCPFFIFYNVFYVIFGYFRAFVRSFFVRELYESPGIMALRMPKD